MQDHHITQSRRPLISLEFFHHAHEDSLEADSFEAYYNLAITGWLLAAPPPSRSAASALSPPRSNNSPTERYI
jgi:hypothetical protein